MAQLSSKALNLLRDDEDLQIAIGKLFTPVRKVRTVKTWIKDNDKRLTTHDALILIQRKFGLSNKEVLEEKSIAKAV